MRIRNLLFLALLLLSGPALADGDKCAICGKDFGQLVYIFTDKVVNEKKRLCGDCAALAEVCFVCGLPVRTNYTKLPDSRLLCERDAKNAILDDDEAKQICEDTRDTLDRLFSRFLSFPSTNLTIGVVDRINLLQLFRVPGNDFECPNVLGYIQCKTNRTKIGYEISLLGGLPRSEFKAVCAHELTHAWVFQNVPVERRKTLGHDAHEGFCELIAYLLMDSESDEDQKKMILRNAYTRGQIALFIEAEKQYGFNEVLDWMKFGLDALLHGDDLNRLRNITVPLKVSPVPLLKSPAVVARPASQPQMLALNGIVWNQTHPTALINGRTFAPSEEARVKLGQTNVLIRCVAIRQDGVRIRIVSSGQEHELSLAKD